VNLQEAENQIIIEYIGLQTVRVPAPKSSAIRKSWGMVYSVWLSIIT
jgi:hypothetical protein